MTTARKAEGSRTYTKSAAWFAAHDRVESQRRERRAGQHDYVPDKRVGHDECRDCQMSWNHPSHRR
jgi:hypothetical protein